MALVGVFDDGARGYCDGGNRAAAIDLLIRASAVVGTTGATTTTTPIAGNPASYNRPSIRIPLRPIEPVFRHSR